MIVGTGLLSVPSFSCGHCRSMPATERSRAVAFVFGGLNVGSIAGYAIPSSTGHPTLRKPIAYVQLIRSPMTCLSNMCRLLLAPQIIESYGWESVFYIFGVLGILWYTRFLWIAINFLFGIAYRAVIASSGVLHLNLRRKKVRMVARGSRRPDPLRISL